MDGIQREETVAAMRARLAEIGLDEEPETAAEVISEFVAAIESHARAIEEAAARADLSAVAQAAHKLAGTAVTLGADPLGRLASRLESDAVCGRPATLEVQSATIAAEAANTVAAASSLLASV